MLSIIMNTNGACMSGQSGAWYRRPVALGRGESRFVRKEIIAGEPERGRGAGNRPERTGHDTGSTGQFGLCGSFAFCCSRLVMPYGGEG